MIEKWTYLPYSRGIDPKRLRLGSLVLDIYNPATGLEKKRFKYLGDEPQEQYWDSISRYAPDPQTESPCSLNFTASHDSSFAAALADTIHFDAHKSNNIHVTILGSHGRRFEVEEPERFFRDAIYTQPGVEQWIRKQLTISFFSRAVQRLRHQSRSWKAPDIWVCTGIQLITGGRVLAGHSKTHGGGAGVSLDAGMLAGGPPIGVEAGSFDFSKNTGHSATTGYGHGDERVWAAQFYRLDVEFGKHPATSVAGAADALAKGKLEKPLKIDLYEVEDLGASAVRLPEDGDDGDDEGGAVESIPRVATIVGLEALPKEHRVLLSGQETASIADSASMRVDEIPYKQSMLGVDWSQYEKYSKYLERAAEYDT